MPFHTHSLLITVDHFLSKMESMPLLKQKWVLDSKDEYSKISVKQLSQWITNTKLLFKTNRSYKNNNRKITEYFGMDSSREDNISKTDLLTKMISGKDNKNNEVDSNNYLDTKNKKWFRTRGKNIDDHSNDREEHQTKYLNKFTSILPLATDTNPLFEYNQAERNNTKKMNRKIKKY